MRLLPGASAAAPACPRPPPRISAAAGAGSGPPAWAVRSSFLAGPMADHSPAQLGGGPKAPPPDRAWLLGSVLSSSLSWSCCPGPRLGSAPARASTRAGWLAPALWPGALVRTAAESWPQHLGQLVAGLRIVHRAVVTGQPDAVGDRAGHRAITIAACSRVSSRGAQGEPPPSAAARPRGLSRTLSSASRESRRHALDLARPACRAWPSPFPRASHDRDPSRRPSPSLRSMPAICGTLVDGLGVRLHPPAWVEDLSRASRPAPAPTEGSFVPIRRHGLCSARLGCVVGTGIHSALMQAPPGPRPSSRCNAKPESRGRTVDREPPGPPCETNPRG